MKPLKETHGTGFELIRHFLLRMLDSELFSTPGEWQGVAIGGLSLLLLLGPLLMMMAPGGMVPPGLHPPSAAASFAAELGLLTFLQATAGLLALLAWQSLFPARRDYYALASLPVRSRQIFAARFVSMLLVAVAVSFTMSLLPGLAAPGRFGAGGSGVVAFFSGCLFLFFLIAAIQGILLNLLPARWFAQFSPWVQGGLIMGCVLAGLYAWFMMGWSAAMVSALPQFGRWLPPVWFVALRRSAGRDPDPFLAAMAGHAIRATVTVIGMTALTYVLVSRRYRKLLLETPDGAAHRGRWRWSPLRLLARRPRQQAILQFIAAVLTRSGTHRLVLMAYAGGGLAIMVAGLLFVGAVTRGHRGWAQVLQFMTLYWPIGLPIVILSGLRHCFRMPAEWPARWMFQIAENEGRREWMSAVERFVVGGVLAPIVLLALPIAIAVMGWPVALRMAALQMLIALTVFELLFYSWQQLPFTCSYLPGKHPMVGLAAGWLVVLAILVPALAGIVAALSAHPHLFLFYAPAFGLFWCWARRRRREGWGEAKLIYEDRLQLVADLGIGELGYYNPEPPSTGVEDGQPSDQPDPTGERVAPSQSCPPQQAKIRPAGGPGACWGPLCPAGGALPARVSRSGRRVSRRVQGCLRR